MTLERRIETGRQQSRMSSRRRVADSEGPTDAQLGVLQKQVADAVADGEKLVTEPLDQGRWNGWEIHLEDLLGRALGPDHWPVEFRQASGGAGLAIVGDPFDYDEADQLEGRNEDVEAKLGVARQALLAIDQELERRGARPAEMGLPARDFAFIQSEALRAITIRDYGELRSLPAGTVKASALLAGSIIEAALRDALERQGFKPNQLDDLRFIQLTDEAAGARLIQKRTRAAAHSVRDLRNFVHPAVELREGRLREVDARAAIALMEMVLEDLS